MLLSPRARQFRNSFAKSATYLPLSWRGSEIEDVRRNSSLEATCDTSVARTITRVVIDLMKDRYASLDENKIRHLWNSEGVILPHLSGIAFITIPRPQKGFGDFCTFSDLSRSMFSENPKTSRKNRVRTFSENSRTIIECRQRAHRRQRAQATAPAGAGTPTPSPLVTAPGLQPSPPGPFDRPRRQIYTGIFFHASDR